MARAFHLQGSLFDSGPARVDVSFAGLRRIDLDARSWVEHVPGWLGGADALFGELLETGRFDQREVWMYERKVLEPRLTAGWSTDVSAEDLPEGLRAISAALSARYAVGFDRIWVNLYRDGRDSVAWHGDRIGRGNTHDTMVAIVSLGDPRKLHLRPRGGGDALVFEMGHGDLLVMGGSCQRTWEHAVPKVAHAGPRMSVQYRPLNVF